jgi:hypothetical protein
VMLLAYSHGFERVVIWLDPLHPQKIYRECRTRKTQKEAHPYHNLSCHQWPDWPQFTLLRFTKCMAQQNFLAHGWREVCLCMCIYTRCVFVCVWVSREGRHKVALFTCGIVSVSLSMSRRRKWAGCYCGSGFEYLSSPSVSD